MSGGERALLGRWGEAAVAEYLRRKGYQVIAAGWRCRLGEIDLIARNRSCLAFVEVKLRKQASFAQAREYVDYRKQQKLIAAAQLYLAQNPTGLQPRFDVAEVYAPLGMNTKNPEIIYLEDAFSCL